MLSSSVQKIMLNIYLKLIRKDKKKLIKLGFIHFFVRIIKRQHELINKYIDKNV